MTWGEILEYIEVYNEQERRRHRDQGILMYQQLSVLGKMLSPRARVGKVTEEFPYFTRKELIEIAAPKRKTVRDYRELMEGYVMASKLKHEVNDNE